jgi:hypothetical protein
MAIPFLALPSARLAATTGATSGGNTLFRLYGIAILALLFGYASGFWAIARGEFPWCVVVMGLVSSGGAAAILFATGDWRKAVPISVVVLSIAIALSVAAAAPTFALRPRLVSGAR